MKLAPQGFLTNLIQTGPDAGLNLYTINFIPRDLSDPVKKEFLHSYIRVDSVPSIIKRDATTTTIPYQSTVIPKITKGSDITKSMSFIIRVDQDYSVWNALRKLQSVDNLGNPKFDDKNKMDIKLIAYKPKDGFYEEAYIWEFTDCYITSVSPLSYGYNSANTATTTVGFIWGTYSEHFPVEVRYVDPYRSTEYEDFLTESYNNSESIRNALDRVGGY